MLFNGLDYLQKLTLDVYRGRKTTMQHISKNADNRIYICKISNLFCSDSVGPSEVAYYEPPQLFSFSTSEKLS